MAIVGERANMIAFNGESKPYLSDIKEIENWKELGVLTASGNKVRRVPLYEPNNMLLLKAFVGNPIHFRYGGEAGVVPCYSDGTPLTTGKVKAMFEDDKVVSAEI